MAQENRVKFNEEFHYFLIWQNGIHNFQGIINEIEKSKDIDILKLIRYEVKNIKKFIDFIYSFDYAPLIHLRDKTKYLKKFKGEIMIIFINVYNGVNAYFGEKEFRHIENMNIRKLKNNIREKYNKRINNKITQNHVIHASDNVHQSKKLLNYFGYENPEIFTRSLDIPHHIRYKKLILKSIDFSMIKARIIKNDKIVLESILNTPHYKFLKGDTIHYKKYLQDNIGRKLKDYYSTTKFKNLEKIYDTKGKFNSFIIVKKNKDFYEVLDGLHRFSILTLKGQKKSVFMEVIDE